MCCIVPVNACAASAWLLRQVVASPLAEGSLPSNLCIHMTPPVPGVWQTGDEEDHHMPLAVAGGMEQALLTCHFSGA